MSRTILLAIAATLAACSPQHAAEATPAAQAPATHPVSGLPVIPLTVGTPKGKHSFRVEVATTDAQQAQGLMFRKEMGPDEGMIFPRDPVDVPSFWMKNTVLPLDIIFIGTDHTVLNIAANAVPYSLKPVGAVGMSSAVLELNAGRAAELGIVPGAKVDW